MLTLVLVLAIAALLVAIFSAVGKAPLYVAVILLAILECLRSLPLT